MKKYKVLPRSKEFYPWSRKVLPIGKGSTKKLNGFCQEVEVLLWSKQVLPIGKGSTKKYSGFAKRLRFCHEVDKCCQ
jgi:hypothetical protein